MRAYELYEGISPVVYHYSDISPILDILNSNTFKLAPAFKGAEEPINGGKLYFLSTTRTRTGKYHEQASTGVLLKLDGRKLGHNLKGSAVDYWGAGFRGAANGAYEQEDRIVSDKPEIKNAMQYIDGIDIIWNPYGKVRDNTITTMFDVYKMGRTNNIPTNIYTDRASFISGNTKKALTSKEIAEVVKGNTINKPETASEYDRIKADPKNKRKVDAQLTMAFKALRSDDRKVFTKDEDKCLDNLIRYYSIDGAGGLTAAFHNNSRPNSQYRGMVDGIAKEMKRKNIATVTELAKYLVNKWKDRLYQ
jgi:hypothetical protein